MSNVKGSKIHSIDITKRNPTKTWLIRLLILICMLCASGAAYYVGFTKGDTDRIQAEENIDALAKDILDKTSQMLVLNKQLIALQEKYTHLELAAQIDASQVKAFLLKDLEQLEEINELKSNLSFYQSVMSPSDLKNGLTIEQFEIDSDDQLKIILTQVTDEPLKITGDFQVLVTGLLNDEAKVYNLSELSEKTDRVKFGFKFFQRFNIALNLPEAFKPESVTLNAKKTKQTKIISQTISWPTAK